MLYGFQGTTCARAILEMKRKIEKIKEKMKMEKYGIIWEIELNKTIPLCGIQGAPDNLKKNSSLNKKSINF